MIRLPARLAIIASISLSSIGCVDRVMTINSNPEGALVYLNDQEVGRTPLTRDFEQYGNYELEVRKDGFKTLKSTQVTEEPWWQLIPFDLITEVLPYHYRDSRHYLYTLTPATTKPADATVMLNEAAHYRSMLLTSPHTRVPTTGPDLQGQPMIPPQQ